MSAAVDAALTAAEETHAQHAETIGQAQRREVQRAENRAIGDADDSVPTIGTMTEAEMLSRCIHVLQRGTPVVVLPPDCKQYRASVIDIGTFVEAYEA